MKSKIMLFVKGVAIGLVLFCGFMLFTRAAFAASYYYDFATICDNGEWWSGGVVKNSDNSTLLPVNCIIQAIWVGPNGIIDSPNADGSPGGDDVLVGTKAVGTDDSSLISPPMAGKFYLGFEQAASSGGTRTFYIRAWNASTIAGATYFGNSATFTVDPTTPLPGTPSELSIATFSTNTSVVPVAAISSITPNNGTQGTTVPTVAIVGTNTHFVNGSTTVSFGSNITVGSVSVTDATHLTCNNVVIDVSAATGSRTVTVTTGSEIPTVAFTVNPVGAATISSITPSSGTQGATITSVAIVGANTHFGGTTTVSFGSNISVGSVSVTDATHLTCNNVVIDASAATGSRTVTVTTGSEAPTVAFTVNLSTGGGGGGGFTPPGNAIYAKAGGIMMAYPNPFNPNDKNNPLKMLFAPKAIGDTVSIYIFDANGRIIYQDKAVTVDVSGGAGGSMAPMGRPVFVRRDSE